MRVVLDTNVVVSATLIRGGNEDRILRAWQRGAFDLVISPPNRRDRSAKGSYTENETKCIRGPVRRISRI